MMDNGLSNASKKGGIIKSVRTDMNYFRQEAFIMSDWNDFGGSHGDYGCCRDWNHDGRVDFRDHEMMYGNDNSSSGSFDVSGGVAGFAGFVIGMLSICGIIFALLVAALCPPIGAFIIVILAKIFNW